jgi:predicted RNA-binding Zn ribbon-like protein
VTKTSRFQSTSRAGSLSLIAGHLALNFANTASGRGSGHFQEHLQAPNHVLEWADHAGLAAKPHSKKRGAAPAALLREAVNLRNLIYGIGASLAQGLTPQPGLLQRLAASHVKTLKAAALKTDGMRFTWDWDAKTGRFEHVLGPIALSAVAMLTDLDHARIKQCAGKNCGWLFYDETKNNSRRWCEMSVCGNRSKARAARQRKAPA